MHKKLELRVKQVTYEPKISWQHKKAKAARYLAWDLENLCILSENSAENLVSKRQCCWGYVSVSENTPEKLSQLYLMVQGRAQLEQSSHIVLVLRLHANNSSPDKYWRKQLNRQAHLELCHRNPDILERVLNQITLSNSTAWKCAPMQVIKQPQNGRTSTKKEQKWSSFQTNYN